MTASTTMMEKTKRRRMTMPLPSRTIQSPRTRRPPGLLAEAVVEAVVEAALAVVVDGLLLMETTTRRTETVEAAAMAAEEVAVVAPTTQPGPKNVRRSF